MLKLLLLLVSFPCFAADYDVAIENAKQAALIQTGLNANLQKLGEYTLEQTGNYKNEVVLALFLARTYQNKCFKTKIDANKRLTISLNSVTIDLSF